MKKKLLLAGVGDYQGYAQTLQAPVPELDNWESVLTSPPYSLELLDKLADATATKENILQKLDELFQGAGKDDQLVFVFAGHGTIDTLYNQEAVVAYPNGDSDLRNASITFAEILGKLATHTPPADCDITLIFDTCFAAGITTEEWTPLFIPPPGPPVDIDRRRLLRFTHLSALPELLFSTNGEAVRPVIVTASAEDEAAYQVVQDRTLRLLFSFRATEQLPYVHETFKQFEASINPLHADLKQRAAVHGTPDRLNERITGEAKRQLRPEQESLPAAPSDTAEAAADTDGPELHVRILGIGCFIERALAQGAGQRIVFPNDTWGTGSMKHTAFVEVAEDDIAVVTGTVKTFRPRSYSRAGTTYLRWTLTEHKVSLANPTTGTIQRSALFEKHVPSMPVLCPELKGRDPRPESRAAYPAPSLFYAFFDIVSGSIGIGELEKPKTQFLLQNGNVPTWGPENTPRFVTASLPFTGDHAVLLISNLVASANVQVYLKPGATILVGNARDEDIFGPGSGNNPPEHFLINYNLADPKPLNPGLPSITGTPLDACSVTKWP